MGPDAHQAAALHRLELTGNVGTDRGEWEEEPPLEDLEIDDDLPPNVAEVVRTTPYRPSDPLLQPPERFSDEPAAAWHGTAGSSAHRRLRRRLESTANPSRSGSRAAARMAEAAQRQGVLRRGPRGIETGEPYLTPVKVRLHGESDADAIRFPPFLEEAYGAAEAFCELLANRASTGFFRTLLLRRMGSTMEAGRRTVQKILDNWRGFDESEDDEELEDRLPALTDEERNTLLRLLRALESNREHDPKYGVLRRMLVDEGWLQLGCVVFSQYFDSRHGRGLGRLEPATARNPHQPRPALESVAPGAAQGTDSAHRADPLGGGHLQHAIRELRRRPRAATPVAPSQRNLAPLRQLPDTLEDVWVQVALGRVEQARQTIDAVPKQHPFALRYREVTRVDWESCARAR